MTTTRQQQQQQQVPIDTSRFFTNPYHDDADMQLFTTDECLQIVRKLFQKCQDYYNTAQNRPSSYGSLYNGSLGALVFLPWKLARLHRALAATATSSSDKKQHHMHQAQELAAHAQQHVEWALVVNASSHRRVTLLESPWVGAKALQIALWHDNNNNNNNQQQAKALDEAQRFVSQVAASCRKLAAAECEVLYGRAGALQAILFLRLILENGDLGRDAALELADFIVQQEAANLLPRMLRTACPCCGHGTTQSILVRPMVSWAFCIPSCVCKRRNCEFWTTSTRFIKPSRKRYANSNCTIVGRQATLTAASRHRTT